MSTWLTDSRGVPCRFYHGTGAEFSDFRESAQGYFGPGGIYFTDSYAAAEHFALAFGEAARVLTVQLTMVNPYHIDFDEHPDTVTIEALRAQGFDGIVMPTETLEGQPDTLFVVFSPEQVKPIASDRVSAIRA